MRIITRTVWGSALQTALLLQLTYKPPKFSTLNEKFNILPDHDLNNATPQLKYFCIGDHGHRIITGSDSIGYASPINHRASDAALYHHLPFVLRELTNDLTIVERERYALRTILKIKNVPYIAYYLKRIDKTRMGITLNYNKVENGVLKTTEFLPESGNLNPVHPNLPNTGVITTDGTYLSSSSIITITMTEKDIEELVNVAMLLYGNEDRALISEIGLCSGLDHVLTADSPTGSFNYREAVGVQIMTFVTGYYPIGFTNKGFDLQIEAGATEPLLGEQIVTI